MRTLFFGAGPLSSLYGYLLSQAGNDVKILARGPRYEWIKAKGLCLKKTDIPLRIAFFLRHMYGMIRKELHQ